MQYARSTRRVNSLAAATLLAAAAACASPTAPVPRAVVGLPDSVTGTIVTCETCGPPTTWGVIETSAVIVNRGLRDRRVTTVEAIVVNRTRGDELGRNTRPNVNFGYPDRDVPAGSSLALEAGVVYQPLPPPRDDIWLEVVVTFDDGGTAKGETRLENGV